MNEKIPQNMYDAFWEEDRKDGPSRMSAALLWLADNVSDEMLAAFNEVRGVARCVAWEDGQTIKAISAALRAAAGGGEK